MTALTPKDWHHAITAYESGATLDEVAAQHHRARQTIREGLIKRGVQMRARGGFRPPKPKVVPSLADDGLRWELRGNILVGVPIADAYQPAIDYACTFCGASDTEGCTTADGHLSDAHKDRRRPRLCECGEQSTSARAPYCASCRNAYAAASRAAKAALNRDRICPCGADIPDDAPIAARYCADICRDTARRAQYRASKQAAREETAA
jgi:hypothetical protein